MNHTNITIIFYFFVNLVLTIVVSFKNSTINKYFSDIFHKNFLKLFYNSCFYLTKYHIILIPISLSFLFLIMFFFKTSELFLEGSKKMALLVGTGIMILLSTILFQFINSDFILILFYIAFFISFLLMTLCRRTFFNINIDLFDFDMINPFGGNLFHKKNKMQKNNNLFKRLLNQGERSTIPTAFNLATDIPSSKYIIFPQLFRHFLIIGGPGAGKSASILKPFMENSIVNLKQSSFIYDFKGPELTSLAFHFWKQAKFKYGKDYKMKFRSLDFSNPLKSHRCNPISSKYIESLTFAKQITEVLYKNLNKEAKDDFWTLGAKGLISASIWYLIKLSKKYNENLSNFLNLIYFINSEYSSRVIELMYYDFDTKAELATIFKARTAENTIGGLLASTSAALSKLNDKSLIWITMEDDINLDINNPNDPSILCISNKGDDGKDIIYSPIISVFTQVLFSKINVKNRIPCSVIIDELPTIILPSLDKLLNTGRSNKLSIMLAMQAYSQLKTNYGDKEADTIKAGCGSIFYGKVMEPEAAKQANELMGKFEIEKKSVQTKGGGATINKEFYDILKIDEAFSLPPGGFCGISAGGIMDKDLNDQKFLCKFKYVDYNEDKIEIFPDTIQFNKVNNVSDKELFESHVEKISKEKIKRLEDIILYEYWEFQFYRNIQKWEKEFSTINFDPLKNMFSSFNIEKNKLDIELEKAISDSKNIERDAPKLAEAFMKTYPDSLAFLLKHNIIEETEEF